MSAEFVWKVGAMESYPSHEGEENVVFNVHWTCNGTQWVTSSISGSVTSQSYSDSSIGVQSIPYVSGSAYTPYEELTEEQVLGWVFNQMVSGSRTSKADIEANVQSRINDKITPKVVINPLPW